MTITSWPAMRRTRQRHASSPDWFELAVENHPAPLRLPCQIHDEDLWFASEPGQLERAKELCTSCPVMQGCLAGAVQREEPAGVWGGQIFDRGRIVTHKRPRGRPRKNSTDPRGRSASPAIPAQVAPDPARDRYGEDTPSPATSSLAQTPLPQGA
jgi:WhiB family transcriptional regulator, redox-sensing transcriptional regulator